MSEGIPLEGDGGPQRSSRWGSALRWSVSIALTAWLVHVAEGAAVVESFRNVRASWLLAAVASLVATHVVSCWRWRLCQPNPWTVPWSFFALSYWTSLFVGLLLPTDYGGDFVRVGDLRSRLGGAGAAVSVLWSRFSGLTGTLIVFAAFGLSQPKRVEELSLGYAVVISLLMLLGSLALITNRSLVDWVDSLLARRTGSESEGSPAGRWVGLARRAVAVVRELAANRRQGWIVLLLALIAQLMMVLTNTLYGRALGIEISFAEMALVVPLVTLSSLIPISVGGLGVKEGAFVICLTAVGVTLEESLSLALLNRTCLVAFSGIGGLLLPLRGRLDYSTE